MRVFSLCCFLLLSFSSLAESVLPKGCVSVKIVEETLVRNAKKTDLIFIHNLTKGDLWITHPVADPSASAGWSSRLKEDNWSALVLNKKSFKLSCIESKPGHEQEIPCEDAIAVCRWEHAKISSGQKSTFWAAEDMSLSALKAAVGARGFKLSRRS